MSEWVSEWVSKQASKQRENGCTDDNDENEKSVIYLQL
jgi:hypothetical protein